MSSGFAPFWGPNTLAAPNSPKRGEFTSHGTVIDWTYSMKSLLTKFICSYSKISWSRILSPEALPFFSKLKISKPWRQPKPVSLNDDPPQPITNFLTPWLSKHCLMAWPTPYDDAFQGFLYSRLKFCSPQISATSRKAVSSSFVFCKVQLACLVFPIRLSSTSNLILDKSELLRA